MSLRFVIESSPAPQIESERIFTGGQLSIGRSGDVDWQIDDPKMFVSRRHCVISEDGKQIIVTDASSGGLFIDNAANPVGLGNSVPVEVGMRLHLGDFTLRVEAASGAPKAAAPEMPFPLRQGGGSFFPDDDAPAEPPAPPPERPANLPDPFGLRSDGSQETRHKEVDRTSRPLDQVDPFGLDLRKGASDASPTSPPQDTKRPKRGFFDATPDLQGEDPASSPPPVPKARKDIFSDWEPEPARQAQTEKPPPPAVADDTPEPDMEEDRAALFLADSTAVSPDIEHPLQEATADPEPQSTSPKPGSPQAAFTAPRADEDLRDALLRGMGLDPSQLPSQDSVAEMERLGRSMRSLVGGVMLLLRTRAQEKQKVRVAQTIIASADVNPLKFLATPEDALAALIRPRGKGYLAPEEAVEGAFRDLADHQVRTWSALQVALRRMVDKFDPSEIAKEMEDVGLLESLAAGGRRAKLWQIYEDRYRNIAETAEKQFLGDVGVDFRDAYENRRTD